MVKLSENDYAFAMIVYPPVPEEVGSLTAYQCYDGICSNNTNIKIEPCSEEIIEQSRAYWLPSLGEEF